MILNFSSKNHHSDSDFLKQVGVHQPILGNIMAQAILASQTIYVTPIKRRFLSKDSRAVPRSTNEK